MAHISKNHVSLAGEFAALFQLAIRGYDASLTLDHTKNVDILVFDPATNKASRVEVKTNHEKRKGPTTSKLFGKFVTSWQMHEKHERIKGSDLFYCFVHINRTSDVPLLNSFRFFIVPSKVVAEYVQAEHVAWLKDDPTHRATERRQFRLWHDDNLSLPSKDRKIIVPAPLASKYEDEWKNLGVAPSVDATPD